MKATLPDVLQMFRPAEERLLLETAWGFLASRCTGGVTRPWLGASRNKHRLICSVTW